MGDVDMTPFEDAFKEADADGDGKISSADLKKSLEKSGSKVSDEDIDAIMSVADQDGSGSISYEEFCQAIMGVQFMKMRLSLFMGMLFTALDTDGTGYITKDNMNTVAQQSGLLEEFGQAKVDEVFDGLDSDGSGKVNFDQFMESIFANAAA